MKIFLIEFMNMGGAELGIVLVIFLLPAILTLYSIFDIFKSQFKDPNSKILFLILVLLVPFIGSILYLMLRHNYKTKATDNSDKMPV
ncbi:MAG: hypothetical protein EOO89_19740 [Pedobacter sp.]|nr:MAG: hypothetical protein EOO89_19740 [Pedobacter sp.]